MIMPGPCRKLRYATLAWPGLDGKKNGMDGREGFGAKP